MVHSPVFPPVIALGRALDWRPLPLSVRDARRRARELRGSLTPPAPSRQAEAHQPPVALVLQRLTVRRGPVVALREVELRVRPTEVVALMGRNGAGKSTLLASVAGQLQPSRGKVRLGDLDPARSAPAQIVRRAGLVPQDPSLILYADTVAEPAPPRQTATSGCQPGPRPQCSTAWHPGWHETSTRATSPRDSGSASPWRSSSRPRHLSRPARRADPGSRLCREATPRPGARRAGRAGPCRGPRRTHDVELAAEVATRVVILAEGEIVADGPATEVLAGSPASAPQVAKILHPLPFLTVDDVVAALGEAS